MRSRSVMEKLTVAADVDGFATAAERLFDARRHALSTTERMRVLVAITRVIRAIPFLEHRDVRRTVALDLPTRKDSVWRRHADSGFCEDAFMRRGAGR